MNLVECCHSLCKLSLDLWQRLSSLKSLLQLLLGIIQTLLKLTVLFLTLQDRSLDQEGGQNGAKLQVNMPVPVCRANPYWPTRSPVCL